MVKKKAEEQSILYSNFAFLPPRGLSGVCLNRQTDAYDSFG
jgi:hypothetical protein